MFIDQSVSAKNARQVGLWVTTATFLLSVALFCMCKDYSGPGFLLSERHMITQALGLEYHLGVDALSLGFILLTTFFFPLVMLVSWDYEVRELKFFIFLLLVLETLILGALCSLNLLVFYIFFESVLVPVYFLSNLKKESFQEDLGMKNVLYTLLGSIFLLVAMLKLYDLLGTFSFVDILQKPLSLRMQLFLFTGFLFSFLVKIPVFPFHTWIAHTYSNTHAPVSMLLTGAITKLSIYALLRYNFSFHDAIFVLGPYLKWFF
ncbi:MAG: hypothetical protein H6925_05900 [Holosporaceae bacterium]|nr:MAG: hypothetical protein H6925_05900 [Holosporaceae bacterium]